MTIKQSFLTFSWKAKTKKISPLIKKYKSFLANGRYNFFDISKIQRITFREDINGLRAFAVLVVVFYHTEIELFKGGWLGVDIFFVISGYLISNIIISELNDNNFSFQNFYMKRIRRILPALFTTLLTTTTFVYFLLTPNAMLEYSNSLISSIFFYSNYYFENLDFYTAEATKFMPFLHTWSLAIEEQFYILFPFLTYILYKYLKQYFSYFILIFIFISIYLNSSTIALEKFYMLEFRMWELLTGVILMILSSKYHLKHLEKIGAILLVFSVFYFDDDWINDIEPKLISITGICLFIFSNDSKSKFTKVLMFKPIAFIGLSSYSIYLFHQPIYSMYLIYKRNNFYGDINSLEKIILIFLILIISYFSYVLVEKKLAYSNHTFSYLLTVVIVLIFFNLFVNKTDGKFSNLPLVDEKIYQTQLNYKNNFSKNSLNGSIKDCDSAARRNYDNNFESMCIFNKKADNRLILVTDSSGNTLSNSIIEKLDKDIQIQLLTGGSIYRCLFSPKRHDDCSGNETLYLEELIESNKNSLFLFTGAYYRFSNEFSDINKIEYFINLVNKNNSKVLFLFPTPFVKDENNILDFYFYGHYNFGDTISYNKADWLVQSENIFNFISPVQEQFYEIIDYTNIFCDNLVPNYCVNALQENLYYYDIHHLTKEGIELFINDLIVKINIILE